MLTFDHYFCGWEHNMIKWKYYMIVYVNISMDIDIYVCIFNIPEYDKISKTYFYFKILSKCFIYNNGLISTHSKGTIKKNFLKKGNHVAII